MSADAFVVTSPSADLIEAWSERRLPFEPTGRSLYLRAEIRRAVSRLQAPESWALRAAFASEGVGPVDAENVLFYNVGTGHFAGADQWCLVFERARRLPPRPAALPSALHLHRYEVTDDVSWRHWESGDVVAEFGPTAVPPVSAISPMAGIWYATRTGPGRLAGLVTDGVPFGIDLEVSAPTRVHLASLLKPLVDGVVAAFHQHDGSGQPELSQRLAASLGTDAHELSALLAGSERAALGRRRLLWRRGHGVQWNPGDDLCLAARVTSRLAATNAWSISGRVARLIPREAPGTFNLDRH